MLSSAVHVNILIDILDCKYKHKNIIRFQNSIESIKREKIKILIGGLNILFICAPKQSFVSLWKL